MASRKTCDKCCHFKGPQNNYGSAYKAGFGVCSRAFVDDNDMGYDSKPEDYDLEVVYTWDGESYVSGAYVGPKFGCIHWEKKEQ